MPWNDRAHAATVRRPLTTALILLTAVGLTPVAAGVFQDARRPLALWTGAVSHSPTWRRGRLPSSRTGADSVGLLDVKVLGARSNLTNLDPALREALARAARDAGDEGVEVVINSGWRSRERQAQLFEDAVSRYGSEEAAARWVATPDASAHVRGQAVDIGPEHARTWLSRRGAAYGLCQIYGNEPWHYEHRPAADRRGCPPPYADPTLDPRSNPSAIR